MKVSKSRALSKAELEAFAAELDQLQADVRKKVGAEDAAYIVRIWRLVRYSGVLGRGLLFLGWFWPAWIVGTLLLAFSKIVENMELGHNVMHGQYDWMNDPRFNGPDYEWDVVGTSDNWRYTHNYKHHTYTNVQDVDEDIGYGVLRVFPEQPWSIANLFQPLYALLLALFFQWGVALQRLEVGRYFAGTISARELYEEFKPTGNKIKRQLVKDYVVFPLLALVLFVPVLPVFLGNLVANGLRNLWTYMIIFCGHFTADVELFPQSVLENESRGHWYVRQLRGSSNISGGRFFHMMSGNLSHQIEHHMFPDMPSYRYAEVAEGVREICARYGQNYNTGSIWRQFGQVLWRIVRYSFPSSAPQTNTQWMADDTK
ncbi:MAG TPA: acyl-CoA desaturase [Alcanivoracaceae bacterium]|nr:acyl-CoA desaturase [Alcanivoracaceae bacterium]